MGEESSSTVFPRARPLMAALRPAGPPPTMRMS